MEFHEEFDTPAVPHVVFRWGRRLIGSICCILLIWNCFVSIEVEAIYQLSEYLDHSRYSLCQMFELVVLLFMGTCGPLLALFDFLWFELYKLNSRSFLKPAHLIVLTYMLERIYFWLILALMVNDSLKPSVNCAIFTMVLGFYLQSILQFNDDERIRLLEQRIIEAE